METRMKRFIAILSLLALLAAACGDSESEPAATDAPTTTAAPDTTEAPEVTEPAEEPGDDAPAGEVVEVELVEWAVNAPAEITGGTVSFNVTNIGENSHEFTIVRGESYESLPLLGNGAVDEAALGDDFLGRTETFDAGSTITATFDLEPGSYVFLCNISFGPNSHAKAGQVLSVTVN
jgi:hypothetical protein